MATKNQPTSAAPVPEPQSGGSYVRNADGSIDCVQRTEPVQGRVKASREALAQRLAGDAPPATDTPKE